MEPYRSEVESISHERDEAVRRYERLRARLHRRANLFAWWRGGGGQLVRASVFLVVGLSLFGMSLFNYAASSEMTARYQAGVVERARVVQLEEQTRILNRATEELNRETSRLNQDTARRREQVAEKAAEAATLYRRAVKRSDGPNLRLGPTTSNAIEFLDGFAGSGGTVTLLGGAGGAGTSGTNGVVTITTGGGGAGSVR